jgi:two-component system phosphate regulon sensor histidine kinase PhoR
MRRSIVLRIFMVTALLGVLTVIAFTVYTVNAVHGAAFTGLTDGLRRIAETAGAAMDFNGPSSGAQLEELVTVMAGKAGVRLTVVDGDGVVLADSEQDPARMENHKLRPEIAKALAGETGVSLRMSSTLGHDMVYVAVPMERDGKVVGTVRASYSAGTAWFSREPYSSCARWPRSFFPGS